MEKNNFKTMLNSLIIKAKANKINYAIFFLVTTAIAWFILGKLGMVISIVYFIMQIPIIKSNTHHLKDKKIASIFIVGITVVLFGLVFGFANFIQSMIASGMSSYVPKPVTITSTEVKKSDWVQAISTIGEAQATQSTEISSQSGGIVTGIYFKSGQNVKKGDLLFTLDISQLVASLEEAESTLKLTKLTNDRYKKLVEQKATSKESADKAHSDYLNALAQVDNIKSQIAFKEVRAPFDGKIGIRNISLGQFFNNGDNAATLTKINPIFITFSIPQNKVSSISKGQNIIFQSDSYPGRDFKAKITAINSFINSSNRSIIVQATYQNKKEEMVPGMFVTVNVNLPAVKDSIVIPRNAITYSLYGEFVYTLKPILDKNGKPKEATYTSVAEGGGMKTVNTGKTLYKIEQDNIEVIETRNNMALVKGLPIGTNIVTSGQNKIHKGSTVIVNNDIKINNNIYTQES